MSGYVNSIETFGLLDGPGIRNVVFLSGCKLRCQYCHNPEMWQQQGSKMTSEEILEKVLRNKPYFKRGGGVTFSGGEPLLQKDFLIETCQLLKKNDIHIALDTSGVGIGSYDEILKWVDLVLLDIKHIDENSYFELTGQKMDEVKKFIEALNKSGIKVIIRQVVVPEITDSDSYIEGLVTYLKQIKNIEKVEFLPFHHLGFQKYERLNIPNPLKDKEEMDPKKCEELFVKFMKKWKQDEK